MESSKRRLFLLSKHLSSDFHEVCIVAAARSPILPQNGEFKKIDLIDLSAQTLERTLEKHQIPKTQVDGFYFSSVLTSGSGVTPAAKVLSKAGLPHSTVAVGLNKVCASGLKAVAMAASEIMLGYSECVAVVGADVMSNVPYYIPRTKVGLRRGDGIVVDGMISDGLRDGFHGRLMGEFADEAARREGVNAQEMTEFAQRSYAYAQRAKEQGVFQDEIVPIQVKGKTVQEDVFNNALNNNSKPAFLQDGIITALHSSSIADGAAAIVLASKAKARQMGWQILGEPVQWADAEVRNQDFILAPTPAIKKALSRANMNVNQLDLVEINEAFANAGISNAKKCGIPMEKVNIHGGAIAIGHPLGCSGVRVLVTLLNGLTRNNKSTGLAVACNGGGGATAVIIKR